MSEDTLATTEGFMAMRLRATAFTLIELLVVISIIALLIGILLPALGAARAAGRRAVCSANMRGVTQALAIYETEWARLPKRYNDGKTVQMLGVTQTHSWGYDDDLMAADTTVPRSYVCPDHPKNNYFTATDYAQPSYGINWFYDQQPAPAQPSHIILLAETEGADGEGSHRADRDELSPGELDETRHGGRAHYGFFDSHIELDTLDDVSGPDKERWGEQS